MNLQDMFPDGIQSVQHQEVTVLSSADAEKQPHLHRRQQKRQALLARAQPVRDLLAAYQKAEQSGEGDVSFVFRIDDSPEEHDIQCWAGFVTMTSSGEASDPHFQRDRDRKYGDPSPVPYMRIIFHGADKGVTVRYARDFDVDNTYYYEDGRCVGYDLYRDRFSEYASVAIHDFKKGLEDFWAKKRGLIAAPEPAP
jgi:hypothetical protein